MSMFAGVGAESPQKDHPPIWPGPLGPLGGAVLSGCILPDTADTPRGCGQCSEGTGTYGAGGCWGGLAGVPLSWLLTSELEFLAKKEKLREATEAKRSSHEGHRCSVRRTRRR